MKKYRIDIEEIPDTILADSIYEAKDIVHSLITIIPDKICDNTDCPDMEDGVEILHKIILKKEFISDGENGECYWCSKCMIRDRKMIKEVIE